jgi:RNA polymerase sigma-70 factor (ECF subfamily)
MRLFGGDPLADPAPLLRRVYSYAAYAIGPGPDAEDVTSETLERALRYRASYDPRRGSPETWLVGIARRVLADRAARPTTLDVDALELAGPGDLAGEAVDRVAVRAAVARLPERDRELVALRYGADLSARQIGELLDLRTNAVEVALHRTHARLRELLGAATATGRKETGVAPVSDP